MVSYSTEVESRSWFKVTLPVPTVRAEIYKALYAADQEYERIHGQSAEEWDDAYTIEAGDDEIVIRIELPKEKT